MTDWKLHDRTTKKLENPTDWDVLGIIDEVEVRLQETDPEAAAVVCYLLKKSHALANIARVREMIDGTQLYRGTIGPAGTQIQTWKGNE